MKKILFVTLALAIGMTGFAQKNLRVKASDMAKVQSATAAKKAFKGNEQMTMMEFTPTQAAATNPNRDTEFPVDVQCFYTIYDLQSNGFVANRMYRYDDGSVGLVATYSQQTGYGDRGTGYDYFNGDEFVYDIENNPMPGRIEIEKTGWPCYAPYGDGEIIIAHTGTQLTYYTREKKGEATWQGPNYIPNPTWLGAPTCDMTWPKIATSGPNHNIIHVLGADQNGDDPYYSYLFYSRSTDGETWETTWVPTLEDWEHNVYGSDYYAFATNGDYVAILLMDMSGHGLVIKSADNGETWERIKFWDNPHAGDWETDPNTVFGEEDAIYCPETGAICIDNNGMVHCAFSSKCFYHSELGTSYNVYGGGTMDGIFYWNESMGTMVAPEWTCPDDGTVIPSNPGNCFRFWWPTDASGEYVVRNFETNNVIGFVDVEGFSDWSNDSFHDEDYSDYFRSPSALPAICIDENGVIAVGYSCPDMTRLAETNEYMRSIKVSFIEAPYRMADHYGEYTEQLGDIYYNMFKLQEADDFLHSYDEAVALCSPQNTTDMEFWFCYQADDTPGFNVGNTASQNQPSDNYIWGTKVIPDIDGLSIEEPSVASNTKMEIYPNPAVNQLNVRLENNSEISIYNIMGQNVINMQGVKGVNTINVNDLTSGVYFISAGTVTQKFIVK